jgi:hypothetical protein
MKMGVAKLNPTLFESAATLLLGAGMHFPGAAGTTPPNQSSSINRGDSVQIKITGAISTGPANITNAARLVDTDALMGHA